MIQKQSSIFLLTALCLIAATLIGGMLFDNDAIWARVMGGVFIFTVSSIQFMVIRHLLSLINYLYEALVSTVLLESK